MKLELELNDAQVINTERYLFLARMNYDKWANRSKNVTNCELHVGKCTVLAEN